MFKKLNLIGQRFERLVVNNEIGRDNLGGVLWEVSCDCGNISKASSSDLRRGHKKSCGCLNYELLHKQSYKDITGTIFGYLTALEYYKTINNTAYWKCLCKCGNETVVRGSSLRNGDIKSCGCLQLERVKESEFIHGMCSTRFYKLWNGMIQRVTNPNNVAYKDYGGRNITITSKWLIFINFKEDMYESYLKHVKEFGEDNTTLDRWPDVNGNYTKDNCRWATWKEQCSNKRDSTKTSDLKEHKRIRNVIMSKIRNCLIRNQKFSYVFPLYVGCTTNEFKAYIKSLLEKGMTWNNYGRCKLGKDIWQLGHVKDCNKFDLTREADRKECFHYTNLKPVWWQDNQEKRLLDFKN